MAIEIGSRIGAYEITSLLGKGGMGEVYRARDTKLKRDVAIKTLPSEFERDLDRLARFQREAEALAALNHQNIGAVYDLQEFENTRFLVLELVDGETLSEIITQHGPLPLDEALKDAQQICEALEAAHEKGIVHRDLKPANIKRTPNGRVKVLDFGLAKAVETKSNVSLSNSPTLSLPATNAGVILGTAAYMSPEQARGRAVDKRTDIFAFGCVLFEMLTGKRAFDGEDTSDVLSAILRAEPNWNLLPTATPSRVREMLKLCLEKDPKKRRRDAGDVLIDIEQCFKAPMEAATVLPRRSSRLAWVIAGMIGIAAVTLAESVGFDSGYNLSGFSVSANRAIAYRTGYSEVRQLTWFDRAGRLLNTVGLPESDLLIGAQLSPDGQRAAVTRITQGNQDIWTVDLSHGSPSRLTFDPSVDGSPIWSPDGRQIAFNTNHKGVFDLYVKPSSGNGTEQPLFESSHTKIVTDWSSDGRHLLYADIDLSSGYDLWALPLSDNSGSRKPIVVANTPFEEREGQFSPDSHWIAYRSNESGQFEIYVQAFPNATGKWRISTAGGISPRWRRDGNELFFVSLDGKLMSVPVQVSDSKFEFGTLTVLFQTHAATGGQASLYQEYDISKDGKFLINTVTDAATTPISLILNWRLKQ
jgi:serine/threonine protein kinase